MRLIRTRTRKRRAVIDVGVLDSRLFGKVARSRSAAGDRVLPALSRAANHALLWHLASLALARYGGRMGKRAALRGSGSIAATSALVNLAIKPLVRRPRPSLRHVPVARRLASQPLTTSFPSGHAASAFAYTAGAGSELPALVPPVALLAAATAYSRVYTGVHYPSDVATGAAIGLGVGLASRIPWPTAPRAARSEPPSAEHRRLPANDDGSGVAIAVNRDAGGANGRVPHEALRERLPAAAIVEVETGVDELRRRLDEAAEHASAIGICGGDGSANVAAQVALEHGLPLLVIPGGTLNHLAHDLGIESTDDAVDALRAGNAVAIDLGAIDGRIFLNTASFGAYTEMVDRRNTLEPRLGRWPAQMVALTGVLLRGRPTRVIVDGSERNVWMVFVGNSVHEPPGVAPSARARIDDGLLDVRLIDASTPFARVRVIAAMLTGRIAGSAAYRRWTARRVEVASRRPLRLAADGDPFEGGSSFSIEKLPGRLVVYAPPGGSS